MTKQEAKATPKFISNISRTMTPPSPPTIVVTEILAAPFFVVVGSNMATVVKALVALVFISLKEFVLPSGTGVVGE